MNLAPSHVGPMFAGLLLGGAVGFASSPLFKQGSFPQLEKVVPLSVLGAGTGAIIGTAVAILVLLRRESENPSSGMPHSFTSINGMGSTLIGKWDVADDGSYETTEWLTLLWMPVFPVCTYRVIQMPEPNMIHLKSFMLLAKRPVQLTDIGPGVMRAALLLSIIGLCAWYLNS